MLDVTGTVINTNADPTVLINVFFYMHIDQITYIESDTAHQTLPQMVTL